MIGKFGRVLTATALLLFSSLMPLLSNAQLNAQDSGALNLTTSPLPINLSTTPGNTVSTDLRIKNNGTETETLAVGLLKFGANDTSGQPAIIERQPGDDYFDWVTFSEDEFEAEPNVWYTLTMMIDVPESAGLGYYYAVTFQRASGPGQTDQGAGLEGGPAILVLMDVRVPYAERKVELLEFTSKKSVYEFLPAEFNLSVKNSGNIHLIPSGSIFITKGGSQVAVLTVNEGRGNVLPDSTRNFPVYWDDGFPRYELVEENGSVVKNPDGTNKQSLNWDFSNTDKLRFGKFKATALLVYDDGEKDVPIEAVVTFWIIPWRILFAGLLFLTLIGLGLYVIFKRFWHSAKKMKKSNNRKKADQQHEKTSD